MYPIWSLCLSQLRKKKLQNSLIALLILLSTLLIATSATVMSNTKNLFSDMHEQTNGSHQLLTMSSGFHDPHMVRSWWSEQEGVAASELMPYRNLIGLTYEGKEYPQLFLFMMNTPEQPFTVDKLIFAKGTESAVPERGKVWIPTALAYSQGIEPGDKLDFKTGVSTFQVEVSAVVVDVPYGSPFTTNARIWMNNDDYEELLQPMQGSDKYMLALRFDQAMEGGKLWSEFEEALGKPYLEEKSGFEDISSFYLIMNKIIGFVMIFLGIVMIFVALFTIGFTISDTIIANYRTIGILKSVGLTSFQTISVYTLQYSFLSVIAIIPGLFISRYLSGVIVDSSLSYLKTGSSLAFKQNPLYALAVGFFVFLLVTACAFVYAYRARSIQPAQAIRYGMSESDNSKLTKKGHGKSGFGRYPVTLAIAMRNVLKNGKSSALMLAMAVVTTAVIVFGWVLLNSIISLQQNAAEWGYDNSQIAIMIYNESAFPKEEFEQRVRADSRLASMGWGGGVTGVLQNDHGDSLNLGLSVIEGSYEELGFGTLDGYNPRNKNEIALGINAARQLHKEAGDTVEAYIEGRKHTLLITGVYQAISNSSYSGRITAELAAKYKPDIGLINLKNRSDSAAFVEELNAEFTDSISAVTQEALIQSVYEEASALLVIPMSFLGLLFLGVTLIIIYSICRINIRKESRTFGIYKSVGLSSSRIRMSVLLGIVLLTGAGAITGAVVGVYALPGLMEIVLSDYGMVELPLVINSGGIVAAALASMAAAGIGCWLSSRVIRTMSARNLVVE